MRIYCGRKTWCIFSRTLPSLVKAFMFVSACNVEFVQERLWSKNLMKSVFAVSQESSWINNIPRSSSGSCSSFIFCWLEWVCQQIWVSDCDYDYVCERGWVGFFLVRQSHKCCGLTLDPAVNVCQRLCCVCVCVGRGFFLCLLWKRGIEGKMRRWVV